MNIFAEQGGQITLKGTIQVIVLLLSVAAIFFCFYFLLNKTPTPAETNMLAVFLTLLSLLVSWIVTNIYSKNSADEIVRNNAVQIGNAVNSVKSQLATLRFWTSATRTRQNVVADPLLDSLFDHVDQTLAAIDCQIDTTLKGIGGSIGDSDRQYGQLLGQISNLVSERQITQTQSQTAPTNEAYDVLQARLLQLDDQIATLSGRIDPGPTAEPQLVKELIDCPNCGVKQNQHIAANPGQTRVAYCTSCATAFNLHTDGQRIMVRPILNAAQAIKARDSLSPPGFDFAPEEFRQISDVLLSVYRPDEFTLTSLVDEVGGALSQTLTKTRVRRFIQMLYWARLFAYLPSDTNQPPVFVNSIDREGVATAFCKSAGFRVAAVLPNLADKKIQADIKAYFVGIAPDLDTEPLISAYVAGRSDGETAQTREV